MQEFATLEGKVFSDEESISQVSLSVEMVSESGVAFISPQKKTGFEDLA